MDQKKIYASFWLRFLAIAVDWVFITVVAVLLRSALSLVFLNLSTSLIIFVTFYIFCILTYNIFCIYKFGATLGKKFVGIEVVKEEGVLTFFETIRREALLKPISFLLLGMGIFTMFFNLKRQTYYDKKFHTVVLVKKPLSTLKRVFLFIIGLAFTLYLFSLVSLLYGILTIKDRQMRLDIIDELNQKRNILEVTKSQKEEKYIEYCKKKNIQIEQKMDELCSKRIYKIIDKKSKCAFEDLNLNSLREMDNLYEIVIRGIIDVQTQVQNESSIKFKKASTPLTEKTGWMRFTDLSHEYYFNYPKTFSAHQEGENKIILEKNSVTAPHGVDNYIFVQKGESFSWKIEEIEALKRMKVGESMVIRSKDNSLPLKFLTFERLADISLGGKKIKSFINKSVWEFSEGTILYTYLYEGASDYIFGGLTNENMVNNHTISLNEFDSIISTINFN